MNRTIALQDAKAIERMAINKTLKNHGTHGLDANAKVKDGFYRLKDGRIISLQELGYTTPSTTAVTVPNNVDTSSLHDVPHLGMRDGVLRKGFILLDDGRVVSKKQFEALLKK